MPFSLLSEAMWLSGVLDRGLPRLQRTRLVLAGPDGTVVYWTANLLEQNLSLDSVFVFSVIFTSFAVLREYRYHDLFYSVIGAIVFRAIFVLAGTALLSAISWLVFVFGAFLILRAFACSAAATTTVNRPTTKTTAC